MSTFGCNPLFLYWSLNGGNILGRGMFYNLAIKSQCFSHAVSLGCGLHKWYSYFFPCSLLPSLAVVLLSCSFGALPPGDFASLCFPDIRRNEKTGGDWRERQTPSPDGIRLLQCFYPWRVGICGGKCLDTYFFKDSSFPRWHLFFIHLSISELRSTWPSRALSV